MLEGDIETSYTEADNSCVIATDTSESSFCVANAAER
jgi:urate oxidase